MVGLNQPQTPRLLTAARAAAQLLGLYEALAAPMTVAELAARRGLGARRLARLIDVLVAHGDLGRAPDGELLRASDLTPPSGPVIGARLIAEIIRRDRPVLESESLSAQLDLKYLTVHHLLSESSGGPPRELARRLLPELRDGGSLLDAGGGYGAYCAALLELAPNLRALLVDLPHVVAIGRKHLPERAGFIEWREGALTAAPLGEGHRVGLLSNVLHLNSPQDARRIVRRVADSLQPGGLLVVKDLLLLPDRSGPMLALLFGLAMSLFSEAADVDDTATLADSLRDAGIVEVRSETLDSAPEAIVLLGRRQG